VHHYDELTEFKDACAAKNAEDLCVREKDAQDHIALLLDFLDEHVMQEVRTEQERNKNGSRTWEHMWVYNKPGNIRIGRDVEERETRAHIMHSVEGGTFKYPQSPWIVVFWALKFDGTYVGRVQYTSFSPSFDG
jgi:hypothetical protein